MADETASLADQVALVTGGGSGIGASVSATLAARGARVLVVDLDVANGTRVAAEITAAGGEASFFAADVSRSEDADGMVAEAVDRYGALHLAVNNAGIGHPPAPLHEIPIETWDAVCGLDLRGVFLCMKSEIPELLRAGGGAIVNVSSGAGMKAARGLGAYSTAKHGVIGLTRVAAIDYIRKGIRVNAVCPGTIKTPLVDNQPEELMNRYAALMPIGRLGEPVEVAHAIAWLLSPEASYVSGVALEVDAAFLQS
jgi:NAD(P)-dependent dehydrogenase (short-subunit alcohol dehydrogenase family)